MKRRNPATVLGMPIKFVAAACCNAAVPHARSPAARTRLQARAAQLLAAWALEEIGPLRKQEPGRRPRRRTLRRGAGE